MRGHAGGAGAIVPGARLRVAFLGPENSFTHEAAESLFGDAELVPADTITRVFRMVEGLEVDYGVVPVENSLEGPVGETLDNLARSMLHIAYAVEMKITLVVAGDPSAGRVYGHPHALGEAGHVLEEVAPGAERVATASTSAAAAEAARSGGLCVCSRRAAEAHGLPVVRVLEPGVGNMNYTRFIAVGWRDNPRGAERTSLVAAMPDTPGALYHWLEPFARRGVNLKMIYSRPSPSKPWNYIFYVDLEGSRLDERVAAAVEEAARRSLFLRVLGSYPVRRL
ncbi:MAG: ACT domain-containing protein [Crenarchaeota archaeon]|nr:ACT domain-containing protein [Thermoproteota archaeon]